MDKSILKTIEKCTVFGVAWSIILLGIAFIIINLSDYELKDVLFIEGLIFIVVGVLSNIGGNSKGLSIQGLGQANAQYIANANNEISRMEKEKTKDIKTNIGVGVSSASLVIGGILIIIINFII